MQSAGLRLRHGLRGGCCLQYLFRGRLVEGLVEVFPDLEGNLSRSLISGNLVIDIPELRRRGDFDPCCFPAPSVTMSVARSPRRAPIFSTCGATARSITRSVIFRDAPVPTLATIAAKAPAMQITPATGAIVSAEPAADQDGDSGKRAVGFPASMLIPREKVLARMDPAYP